MNNDIIEYSKTSGEIYIDKNIKSVFENAYIKHPKTFNTDKYMYMYSKGDNDYFKNKDTRHYETVKRGLLWNELTLTKPQKINPLKMGVF